MLLLSFAALLPWFAELPPMVDLPQHAGQVAAMMDLLLGDFRWSGLAHLNFATPYLVAYLSAAALHLVFPIATAFKILLSLSYLATVGGLVLLRRRLGGDARLDWLFLPSFFGFPYLWGFLPFLVAAPVCILMLAVGHAYAERGGGLPGLRLLLMGCLLFFSHGLMFLLGGAISGGFLLPRLFRRERPLTALWPFLILAGIAMVYFLTAPLPVDFDANGVPSHAYGAHLRTNWGATWQRLGEFFVYPLGTIADLSLSPLCFAFFAVPLVLGARIDWRRMDRLFPFATIVAIWMLVPNTAMQTGFLYERFALFSLPFYALMFEAAPATPFRARVALLLGLSACLIFFGISTRRLLRYEVEAQDFNHVLGVAAPGGLALSLIFDRNSPAMNNRDLYMHFPAWYQARSHGFVEFNFAFFLPGIVRYRRGEEPNLPESIELRPEAFRFTEHGGARYDYIFTRGASPAQIATLADGACSLTPLAQAGAWALYAGCPAR
ncbi:hypothetical protein C8P66_12460 [Humitalea rosea]|uniref:Membrane protein 6-pyruvoyl-tetrahydropterin synthase-related domain-containing protein n=1 Tax=Humitalea rosea TaxID=990373 RepID=A0A2W7JY48_9PROT|nr:hypothetical protein [Humitalea rosea]PZW40420.1 hypothetical protein C8P66_12460 [Humitalea rosea]